jgi:uncharacterized coiled-coil protein SlyX
MVFQKMHVVVQKSASPLSKKCDKLNRLGVDNWTLTMIDETGQDERITELEHKLKHHDRRIAELKHELDEYKEKYSQLLRTRKKIAGLCSAEASPRKLSRLAGTEEALAQDAPPASQCGLAEDMDLDVSTARALNLKKQITEVWKAGEEVLKAAKRLSRGHYVEHVAAYPSGRVHRAVPCKLGTS